ncbi:hypothetical protein [Rossellomorea sp. YZS02]|uniref:hypothetical protein n=1 Tax=Rossellomorea sp. YZS02 TaxID=3097358 RepID=UPI002A13C307|nr:hypothetical protein [Rossellomorea sp. YZS02]MDX8343108.1 hypothetical protein [Rossellomorea sp. YZS02]
MKKLNNENHSPTVEKSIWKRGKRGSFVAAILGIFIFSLLTVYIISETGKEREHERYVQAEENIQTVYKEMGENLQNTAEGELLKPIEDSKVKSAQSSLEKVDTVSEKEKKKLTSMMKEIKIYNDTVPEANKLQTTIDDLNKILSQDTFDEKLEEKLSLLKREISNKLKEFDQLQNATLKAFISKQYTAQINNLEKEFKNYIGVQEEVQALKKMASEQSVGTQEFEQKAKEVMSQVNQLSNKQMAVMMEDEINKAKAEFQQLMAEAAEKKRREEEMLAQKQREEQASKPKEVNSSGTVSEEKEEPQSETGNPEDELYPLEFTMTGSDGFTFKMSRDFNKYKAGKGYDDIARKYGARFYYTPSSDMSYVIIGRKFIATVSLVSGVDVEYKDLFIDLMTFKSKKYTREQFAAIVDKVIESGEPYKVEEGSGGEILSVENGWLRYDVW